MGSNCNQIVDVLDGDGYQNYVYRGYFTHDYGKDLCDDMKHCLVEYIAGRNRNIIGIAGDSQVEHSN